MIPKFRIKGGGGKDFIDFMTLSYSICCEVKVEFPSASSSEGQRSHEQTYALKLASNPNSSK